MQVLGREPSTHTKPLSHLSFVVGWLISLETVSLDGPGWTEIPEQSLDSIRIKDANLP